MLIEQPLTYTYAGIGSRETPPQIAELMVKAAAVLAAAGFTLRSGGAEGADEAFAAGSAGHPSDIFVPWRGFARLITIGARLHVVTESPHFPLALEIAEHHHPNWVRCKSGARKLHARNVMQVLGEDIHTPSDFVLCWTKSGGPTGGTGQALRIALASKVPIFNLQRPDHLQYVCAKLGL